MMQLLLNQSIVNRKNMLNSILSDELKKSCFHINAHFEWTRPSRILSVKFVNKDTVEIWINLNIEKSRLLDNGTFNTDLAIKYRAYYIVEYIHCLEKAYSSIPNSYFSGLVQLCAINNMCHKKKTICYSGIDNKPIELRPIDVHCAIRTFTRLSIDSKRSDFVNIEGNIKNALDDLLLYTILPETGYYRSQATYSALAELQLLKQNIQSQNCIYSDYLLFKDFDMGNFEDISMNDLLMRCESSRSEFWCNLMIRFYAYLDYHEVIDIKDESFIFNCIDQLQKDIASYYKKTHENKGLLVDNLSAINRLSNAIDTKFRAPDISSGRLHFYR